ncbi:MAG: hypothetical protein EBU66_12695 [Bacteroidetes bacterium]|nr:hypothetical protein [Bacteroidota bacterium]
MWSVAISSASTSSSSALNSSSCSSSSSEKSKSSSSSSSTCSSISSSSSKLSSSSVILPIKSSGISSSSNPSDFISFGRNMSRIELATSLASLSSMEILFIRSVLHSAKDSLSEDTISCIFIAFLIFNCSL